ncbi:MAG: four helix bundle protein [Flavobacterium sp.]|nr:four helix bundle protein [Flavobacterium sp.]
MKSNIIKEKSFSFALEIVDIYKYLSFEKREFVLSKQILRSGTSIGANIREAEHAESKADFIHKLSIALKEANETEYWLDLLYQSEYLTISQFQNIKDQITQQLKLLTSIINTTKNKN